MANFSTNQVRQLYVAKSVGTVTSASAVGAVQVKKTPDSKQVYLKYMGAGGQTRSDLIDISSITSATAVDANKLVHNQRRFKLVLDSTVNSGNIVAGQEYILELALRQYGGLSEEDQYFKFGVVLGYTGLTASGFYKAMALSLAKNLKRDVSTLVNVYLETGGTVAATEGTGAVAVTGTTTAASLTGTYTGLIIEEAVQEWHLGTMQLEFIPFTVLPKTITYSGIESIWGVVNEVTAKNSVTNGKNIADLEYFCMGERGDIYRNVGWPKVIPTTYLVDATLAYNVINLHYSYTGANEGAQKSEKDITIVVPKVGATNSVSNVLANSVISAINTATGLSITALGLETA